MKVLLVINSSNNGGAMKMIVSLYHEVVKLHPNSKLVFLQKIESQYANIEGAYYLSDRLKKPGDYATVYARLKQIIADEKPDATISFLPLANIFTAVLARKAGVKTRISSQRNPPQTYGRIMRMLDQLIGERGYYTANVCNSVAGMEAFGGYSESYRKHLSVIENCVEQPDESISKEEARAAFGLQPHQTVLLTVARLHEQKNHAVLIRMMKHLDNAVLCCAGDGPLREEIEQLIASEGVGDRVRLLGDQNRAQVRQLLRAADIFMIPSRYEGLSNSLLEALSYGLPVVFSKIPSFTTFLKLEPPGEYAGSLVETDDPTDWAAATRRVMEDSALRQELGARALAKVAGFTPANMARRFLALVPNGVDSKQK